MPVPRYWHRVFPSISSYINCSYDIYKFFFAECPLCLYSFTAKNNTKTINSKNFGWLACSQSIYWWWQVKYPVTHKIFARDWPNGPLWSLRRISSTQLKIWTFAWDVNKSIFVGCPLWLSSSTSKTNANTINKKNLVWLTWSQSMYWWRQVK